MSIRLSTTSYLVLGLIAFRGPSTSYDLKRAVGKSVGFFWPFPHAQLYDEPARLARAGLLSEEQEDGGRRRRLYRIAPGGRAALREWLREPGRELIEFRDVAQLKLFFGELGEPENLRALAEAQVGLHRERLALFEGIAQRHANYPDLAIRMRPLDLGLRVERACLAFWEDVRRRPPALPPAGARPRVTRARRTRPRARRG
jgi:DNA-binding PadR family transcriptional regulator